MAPIGIALVGAGYWGKNYARALTELPAIFDFKYICDLNDSLLADFALKYPKVTCTKNIQDALNDPSIQAFIVVTPATTHFKVASMVIKAKKHLLCEKPLTIEPAEADELCRLATEHGVRLMTGFTFLFVPAVMKAREIMRTEGFGKCYYMTSKRVNLGPVRRDVNVVWDLVPHDLAMFQAWLDEEPVSVSATGSSFLAEKEDAVNVSIKYASGQMASIFASWAEPRKVREFVIVGSGKTLVLDDVDMLSPLKIYHKGVDSTSMFPSPDEFGSFKLVVKSGSLEVPELGSAEPLKTKLQHFASCVLNPAVECIASGQLGAMVTRMLAAIDRSIKTNGAPVMLADVN